MSFARLIVLAALTAFCAAPASTSAIEENGQQLTVKRAEIGFGGKYKSGFWQPVRLTLVAGSSAVQGSLDLVLPDGDQSPAIYDNGERGKIDLAAGKEKSLTLYTKSGPAGPILLRLISNGTVVWSRDIWTLVTQPLPSTQELVVSLGPTSGVEQAAASIRRRADTPLQAINVSSAAELPDQWWGYDGVDVLLLTTSDDRFLQEMTSDQRQAIVDWVLHGGRIVLSVGSAGAEFTAKDGPWKALLPGEFVEVDVLRDRSGLENFTKSELPFDEPYFQRNRPPVTRLKNTRGEVLVEEVSSASGRPLVVHATAGLGLVTFVGLDLDHPSLKEWKGRTRLLATLLQRGTAEREQSDREIRRGVTHLGYEDLIGQLRAGLDQFPGVSLVSFTSVAVLTIVYLLLIGPGDYFLLSRLNLPRQLTWFTFPLVAVGMMTLAGMMVRQVHGRQTRLNQAEIIDIDLAQQIARGTVWCHLFSPRKQSYDLKLQLAAPANLGSERRQGWLAWQGLPGDSLGGLESRQPALLHRDPYTIRSPGPNPEISGLTVQIASSKSLAACWWSKTTLPYESKLTVDRYGLLAGEFRLPLAVSLQDCLLAHGEKLYRLGALSEGSRVQMAELAPLDLESRLTERRVENTKDISTPWDQSSFEIPRIMQMLMFHGAARGKSYTGLTHRYQGHIDLSEHVRLGQAVLVGRAKTPVASLHPADSQEALTDAANANAWTWFRIILPVSH